MVHSLRSGHRSESPNDFEKIDADGDWKLDREEARSYFDAKGQGQQIDLDALWRGEDEDGDGFISWAEFTGPKGDVPPPPSRREKKEKENVKESPPAQRREAAATFEALDTDKDRKLSRVELGALFASMGQPMTDEFWEGSDKDGDGFVSWSEFAGPPPPSQLKEKEEVVESLPPLTQRQQLAGTFEALDTSRDGKLSKVELNAFFLSRRTSRNLLPRSGGKSPRRSKRWTPTRTES